MTRAKPSFMLEFIHAEGSWEKRTGGVVAAVLPAVLFLTMFDQQSTVECWPKILFFLFPLCRGNFLAGPRMYSVRF
eukprot:scaffold195640_cov48-Prasinocladus_malaysianus.AAC.1